MRYVDKQFLSQCYGESGSIVVQFSSPTLDDYSEGNYNRYVDGDIAISDCSKTINLDFTFSDENSMNKRIAKLDKMIEILQNARENIPKLFEDLNKVGTEFSDFEKNKQADD